MYVGSAHTHTMYNDLPCFSHCLRIDKAELTHRKFTKNVSAHTQRNVNSEQTHKMNTGNAHTH